MKEFNSFTRSLSLSSPVSICEDFTELALRLRDRIDLGPQQLFRLVGVGLSNFLLDQAEADDSVPVNENGWTGKHTLPTSDLRSVDITDLKRPLFSCL